MPPQERRFLTGYRKQDDDHPGLIQEDDETVWVILPDGSRVELNGEGVSTLVDLTDVNAFGLSEGDSPVWDTGTAKFVMQTGTAGPAGPTGAAGSGGAGIEEYQLDANTTVGATAVVLDRSPSTPVYEGQVLVVDAFTPEAETRKITSVAGTTINLDLALKFAHTANDFVVVVQNWTCPAEFFGLVGDGSDEWAPVQRLFAEATRYGLAIRGGGNTYSIGQPVLVFSGSRVERLELDTLAGFAPVDPVGAAIQVGVRFIPFTAAAATNTFTAAGHAMTQEWESTHHDQVSFCAPYGETLPEPLVAGRVYYVASVPVDNSTFTISETFGGPTFELTADGSGQTLILVNTLARVYWESLRLDLNVADLSGILMGIQQPSWTRNLRVEMNTPATTGAIGCSITGQLSYHENVEVNTDANCTGLSIIGVGHVVRGFNCNGVLDNDTGLVFGSGRTNTVYDPWTEQCGRAGIELKDVVRGVAIEGTWLYSSGTPLTSPALLVSSDDTSYTVGIIRTASTSTLLVNDTARSITISAWDGASAGETDSGLVFAGMRQPYQGHGPRLRDQFVATVSTDWTARRVDRVVAVSPTAASRTVSLGSAVGWMGLTHTIKHSSASANTVTVDPSGSQTIDGAATVVLNAWESVTVVSNGANWLVIG